MAKGDIQSEILNIQRSMELAKARAAAEIARIEGKLDDISVKKSALRLNKIKAFFAPFGTLLKDFSPYLVLLIIILLFIGLAAAPSRKNRPGRKLPTSSGTKIKNGLKKLLEKLFPTTALRRWFNPFGKVETIPRTQNGGRCDNMGWRQQNDPSEPYGGGLCTRTFDPKPYEWQIDTSKNPDYDKLPGKIQTMLTGEKTKVYIPYAKQATFYVPQCNDAYYIVGDEKKKFADDGTPLLVDNGLSCTLAQKPLPTLHTSKYRLPSSNRDNLESCTI